MRLLIMFGPLIVRQFQKRQRSRGRQTSRHPEGRRVDRGRPQRKQKKDRGEYVEYKDLNKELGIPTEENMMDLKEEEIMLNEEDLRHYDRPAENETSQKLVLEELKEEPIKVVQQEEADLEDLKDIFLNDE